MVPLTIFSSHYFGIANTNANSIANAQCEQTLTSQQQPLLPEIAFLTSIPDERIFKKFLALRIKYLFVSFFVLFFVYFFVFVLFYSVFPPCFREDFSITSWLVAGSLESAYSLNWGAREIWGQDLGTFMISRPI